MRTKLSSDRQSASRRGFLGKLIAAGAAGTSANAIAQPAAGAAGRVRGFDHVALPMQNTDGMLAFYRGLGFDVVEGLAACSVYIGDNMINFHRPVTWQRESFTLRAPAAKPRAATCVSSGTAPPLR